MSFVSLNAQLEGVFGYKLFSSVREAATPYDTSTRHTHRLFLSLCPTPPPFSLTHTSQEVRDSSVATVGGACLPPNLT